MQSHLTQALPDQGIHTPSYQFTPTQDWFSFHALNWQNLFPLVSTDRPSRALEIGSWEGRSSVFLLNQLCGDHGEIVCIDHFDLFATDAGEARHAKFVHNLSLTEKKFRVMVDFSVPALMQLLREEALKSSANAGFDWIYVDGSHEADDTMLDGELAWRLARKGCMVVFDDYHWDKEPEDSPHHPKRGIDAFLQLHQGEYEIISKDEDYQVVLKKKTEMRIGMLFGNTLPSDERNVSQQLGYGIHIVVTVDSVYAMAAAVTLHSAIMHTPERLTIYIVDCGLTSSDRDQLRASLQVERTDVTLLFLDLPHGSLVNEYQGNAVWAKIDMLSILPVERVLYLDADTLIRSSLVTLWETDLEGMPIAATRDVGHPMGHHEIPQGPYFNAGVLIIDLALMRGEICNLYGRAKSMKASLFRDQDVLNVHFQGKWKELELQWNAQGLGTYAHYPSSEREQLDLQKMQSDPAIVHFTGPVYPSLEEILNPYVQPFTSKPWGYGEARAHPFRDEWWAVAEQTAWKGKRNSQDWMAMNLAKLNSAIEEASGKVRLLLGLDVTDK